MDLHYQDDLMGRSRDILFDGVFDERRRIELFEVWSLDRLNTKILEFRSLTDDMKLLLLAKYHINGKQLTISSVFALCGIVKSNFIVSN